mmetsp:Transcript_5095/g.9068  ORF Transcript_5095/g.9068 Transcript_5095/m.9068 type:complete len:232 (+) Transcript_5095:1305-2000(+)
MSSMISRTVCISLWTPASWAPVSSVSPAFTRAFPLPRSSSSLLSVRIFSSMIFFSCFFVSTVVTPKSLSSIAAAAELVAETSATSSSPSPSPSPSPRRLSKQSAELLFAFSLPPGQLFSRPSLQPPSPLPPALQLRAPSLRPPLWLFWLPPPSSSFPLPSSSSLPRVLSSRLQQPLLRLLSSPSFSASFPSGDFGARARPRPSSPASPPRASRPLPPRESEPPASSKPRSP